MQADRNSICSSLREFGLNQYEAKTYFSLLHDGALYVGDLAHKAGIPRTKTYPTVKSLQRKGLVRMTSGRPVKCFPIPPDECLTWSVTDAKRRVEELQRTITTISRIAKNRGHQQTIDEKNVVYNSQRLSEALPEIILSAYRRIYCALDTWGVRLLESAKEQIVTAASAGVDIRCLCTPESVSSAQSQLPNGVTARIGSHEEGVSIMIFDDDRLLVVNSVTGSGVFSQSKDMVTLIADKFFTSLWDAGLPTSQIPVLANLPSAEEFFMLLRSAELESTLADTAYESITDFQLMGEIGLRMITVLENRHKLKMFKEPMEIVVPAVSGLIAEALKAYSEPSRAIEDKSSTSNGVKLSVWWFILMGLLKRNGLELDTLGSRETHEAALLLQTILPNKLP